MNTSDPLEDGSHTQTQKKILVEMLSHGVKQWVST